MIQWSRISFSKSDKYNVTFSIIHFEQSWKACVWVSNYLLSQAELKTNRQFPTFNSKNQHPKLYERKITWSINNDGRSNRFLFPIHPSYITQVVSEKSSYSRTNCPWKTERNAHNTNLINFNGTVSFSLFNLKPLKTNVLKL
jgi:hypothetical protein